MKFAIIGLGYIAPRHVKVIYDLGHTVKYACDISTNVGWLDSFDRGIKFTTCETEFFRWTADCDYTVICTPNHLHFQHCLLSRSKYVICEKPLVLSMYDFNRLYLAKSHIRFISQLRLHPEIVNFKRDAKNIVEIVYRTPRGDWYSKSWKGDVVKSGGLLSNIGIHLFDLLLYMFGNHKGSFIDSTGAALGHGHIEGVSSFDYARAAWSLSIASSTVDKHGIKSSEGKIRRDFLINGQLLDLSDNDLHIQNYEAIINEGKFKLHEAEATIKLLDELRKG